MNRSTDETSAGVKTPGALAECLAPAAKIAAVAVLAVYFPVLLVFSILVLLTSHGPAFIEKAYKRADNRSELVYLYEFRTEDPRTLQQTAIGRFLVQTELYRIPRLINVLRGDVAAGERITRHTWQA